MIDDMLAAVAVAAMAAAAVAVYLTVFNFSTPAPCAAAKIALQNPGSELVVYGRFKAVEIGDYLYLDCGLYVEKNKTKIQKTAGRLVVGSTPSGELYIR